jgi:hypothetical protein
MKLEVRDSLDKVDAEAIVVGVREGVDAGAAYDARFASIAQPLFASGDLPLKALETFVVPGNPKTVFVGIAKAADADAWRKAAATVVRRVRKVRTLAFVGGDSRAIAEGITIGSFSVETYKTSNGRSALDRVTVVSADSRGFEEGQILAESTNWRVN